MKAGFAQIDITPIEPSIFIKDFASIFTDSIQSNSVFIANKIFLNILFKVWMPISTIIFDTYSYAWNINVYFQFI